MLEDLSDRAVQGPEKAREETAMWLGRLARGLRADEAPPLRDWLKDLVNRTVIPDMARHCAAPTFSRFLRAHSCRTRADGAALLGSILIPALKITIAAGLIAWIVSGEQPRLHFHSHWTHLQGSRVEPP